MWKKSEIKTEERAQIVRKYSMQGELGEGQGQQ